MASDEEHDPELMAIRLILEEVLEASRGQSRGLALMAEDVRNMVGPMRDRPGATLEEAAVAAGPMPAKAPNVATPPRPKRSIRRKTRFEQLEPPGPRARGPEE